MSTPPTMSLTAKIDLLRKKGLSDDEIDQLLASPASSEPVKASPFNMAEMVNNGSSIEEWNKQVDETEKLYINTEAFSVLFIGIAIIINILNFKGYFGNTVAIVGSVICFVLVALVQVFSAPKYREKIKFFVKKR
ncbi:hypothetical protein UB37_19940 [Photobacterium iliopiscarium]|uniref:Peroxisome membrane anchor protein Pex14p N-terminal domain-containing protein n=1 Tax=Photobacterium iliopiscarium TaxID=56192 RepID=A0ABX5GLQ3_9GAMM|nr:hypothetical protein [Photobacterium iliopiscarium]KJG16540.1 hypothetical protein UB37_19940 [Photobacterium iliopiscarium]PSW88060.1 hypothetical protein C9J52_20570 [Photobacterium iliopiscarium]